MKTELHWQQVHAAQAQRPPDRLGSSRLGGVPMEADTGRRSFGRMLAIEQADENRRLSTAAAFSMFIFGFSCGAVWTIFLTWLL